MRPRRRTWSAASGRPGPIGQPSNGYGLTETSSVTSMNSGGDYVAKPDSVGPPVPVTDVAVVPEDFAGEEPDDTIPSGPDVRGELWIKGPQVVRGYWHRPEETAQVFTRGWLHTGDVARLDDGELHLHRRPGQGHDHPRRRERLLGAGRGGPVRTPGRGRLRRDRRARARRWARRSAPSSCCARAPRWAPTSSPSTCATAWPASWSPPTSGSATSPSPATRPARCSSAQLRDELVGPPSDLSASTPVPPEAGDRSAMRHASTAPRLRWCAAQRLG